MSNVNTESNLKMKEFIAKQESALCSFVRCTLELNETDKFKIDAIKHFVDKQRRELSKFESSLEWEDE